MPAGDCSGAGAPTGVTLIEGDELGKHYRGMLLSADAGRNIIFGYKPQLSGAGYDLSNRVNLISSIPDSNERYVWNDTAHARNREKWFRPSDVTVGTDGALYVADWYDPVVGGHQMQDRKAYGRIYRITRKGEPMRRPLLNLSTIEGQMMAIKSPAINVRNEGYRRLLAAGDKSIEPAKNLLKDDNSYVQARAIWLLAALGESGIAEISRLLNDNNEIIRATAFRALRKHDGNGYEYAKRMADDPSLFVRREVIASLSDMPYETARPLLLKLAGTFDGNDRWYLEALGKAVEGHEEDFYSEVKKTLKQQASSTWSKPMAMLAWRLHPPSSVKDLAARASDPALNDKEREMAITALAFCTTREAAMQMLELSKNNNANTAALAKYWLAMRQNNDWVTHLDWNKLNVNTSCPGRNGMPQITSVTLCAISNATRSATVVSCPVCASSLRAAAGTARAVSAFSPHGRVTLPRSSLYSTPSS
jgi:HEAT repeat protein